MNNWQEDKKWSDRFIEEIKAILGIHLIGEAPKEEDMYHNTDLIVLSMKPLRIACRIRRYEFYVKYPDDFTIRRSRPSGTETEGWKILNGWGDYLFYGFSDIKECHLVAWRIIDLDIFRKWYVRIKEETGEAPGIVKANHDDSSTLRAFDIKKAPSNLVYAKSGDMTYSPITLLLRKSILS